ncbi:DUF4242 domain-containing protein [Roseisolibacter sp. H3M3-2]|uniref:DUF4242 domain-containing protein n=1 Tax=Roseisolibacter sp. H3M3-2 TaxID=3031323 RepID=UPI0023D9F1BB|nr:DUF4242 domain-containing protein [Roseisolibacter sp. H3M3-2]MDF1504333.1 DUF4242 domain-containing protein [Roseisolibacter sp. H3M3-2]
MPKFLIERQVPGAGELSRDELMAIAQHNCAVLEQIGPKVQWVQSFVTGDRLTCVYIAPDEAAVREHARLGGFRADRVERIVTTMDPTSAEPGAG